MENNGYGVKGWGFMVGVRGFVVYGFWFVVCQLGVGVGVGFGLGGLGVRGMGFGFTDSVFLFS